MIYLSIIVPVYNESKRLGGISQIIDFLKGQRLSSELIVVNDGSTDDSLRKLKNLKKSKDFNIISYIPNRGKGFAIKTGMLKAQGKYRLFMDVDLSTPLKEFKSFKPLLNKYPVVIGSRKKSGARLLKRQPPLREALGKVFTWLSKTILQVNVSDFTCGFKCFSKEAAQEIFGRSKIEGWGFDSEALFLAKKLKYKVREVPVTWENNSQTKVKFPEDIIRSLHELFYIRWAHMTPYFGILMVWKTHFKSYFTINTPD